MECGADRRVAKLLHRSNIISQGAIFTKPDDRLYATSLYLFAIVVIGSCLLNLFSWKATRVQIWVQAMVATDFFLRSNRFQRCSVNLTGIQISSSEAGSLFLYRSPNISKCGRLSSR